MIVPLAVRLNHRPYFLALVYIVIASMLKSYPSVSCAFNAIVFIITNVEDFSWSFSITFTYILNVSLGIDQINWREINIILWKLFQSGILL